MNTSFILLQRNSFKKSLTQLKRTISTNEPTPHNNRIDGIYPPICTPFLPMKNEPISWKHLESNLKIWEKIPFKGYVVHGSNGEYPFLTNQERVDLVKAVRENTDKNKIIIAGASGECMLGYL
jgi:dihydrodipicolinate synthase/N-acetylneuraminate lyase